MGDRRQLTRRALALLAGAAAGMARSAGAAQERGPAAEAANPEERLRRAAGRLARCPVSRDTQPALRFSC